MGAHMSTNIALQRVDERGWRRGFNNLLSKENSEWWPRRRWLIRTLIWIVLISAMTATALWQSQKASTEPSSSDGSNQVISNTEDPVVAGTLVFVLLSGLAGGVRAILVMQGAILDEKKSGTAAWILSKPVSRSAFIVSKLLSQAVALLIAMVMIPGVITCVLLTARNGSVPSLLPFMAGISLIGLYILFFLTLALMLGTLFEERGLVIGIPLLILFGSQLLVSISPALDQITPWLLVTPSGQEYPLALLLMLGQPLPSALPVIATVSWIVLFVSVSVWRFAREEF